MEDNSHLAFWAVVWLIVIAVVIIKQWRDRATSAGISFSFLLNLWVIFWPGAVVYLLPWYLLYEQGDNLNLVEAGFQQSAYAAISFAAGTVILAPFLMRLFQFPRRKAVTRIPDPRLAKIYLVIGLVFFLGWFSPISRIRTIGALFGVGWNFLVVGVCLGCWKAWQDKRRRAFLAWLAIAFGFPLITIVVLGFLSFGIMLFLSVFTFISSFIRPRWKFIVATLLLAYLGISFLGTYNRGKEAIREVVWAEEAAPLVDRLVDRVDRLYLTLGNFEWFDPFNPIHLLLMDLRLNMGLQVGRAVEYLASGNAEYARGETIWEAIIGTIPAALWPDKPVVTGGSDFVSRYTGLEFGEATSVAIGLVMEFYVNFGTIGVVLGFLCLGVIVAFVDVASGRCLAMGDWRGFALWFLVGIALVKAETSLVILTTGAGAAVVTAIIVNRYLINQFAWKRRIAAGAMARSSTESTQGLPQPGLK